MAEKQRRARIRSNEALQDVLKAKLRERYLKRKSEGKVIFGRRNGFLAETKS